MFSFELEKSIRSKRSSLLRRSVGTNRSTETFRFLWNKNKKYALLWLKLPTEAEFILTIHHQRIAVCNTGVGNELLMKIQAIWA